MVAKPFGLKKQRYNKNLPSIIIPLFSEKNNKYKDIYMGNYFLIHHEVLNKPIDFQYNYKKNNCVKVCIDLCTIFLDCTLSPFKNASTNQNKGYSFHKKRNNHE